MRRERRLAEFLYERRKACGLFLLVATVISLIQFQHFDLDYNLLNQIPKGSPERERIDELEDVFGRSDLIVVALESEDIFTPERLGEIERLTQEFSKIPEVESVLSLSNAAVLQELDGEVATPGVMDSYQRGEQSLEELRAEVLGNTGLVKQVISEDGTAAAINLFIEESMKEADERDALMDRVSSILETIRVEGLTGGYTGNNPLIVDAIRAMKADLILYVLLTPVAMGILLILLFRQGTIRTISLTVLVPLILIFLSVVCTLGIFFGLRQSLGLATTLLPTLIALITLSDVIHGLALYFAGRETGASQKDRIVHCLEHLLEACFMTSVTTAIGIGSLMSSEVQSIRQFGIWAAVGIFLSYAIVMLGLPSLLSWFPGDSRKTRGKSGDVLLQWASRFSRERGRAILYTSLAVLLVCGWYASEIEVEAQTSKSLPESAPSLQALNVVDQQLSGIGNLEGIFKGEPGVFREPWALEEVGKMHEHFASIPEMNLVISPWSILRDLHQVVENDGRDLPKHRDDIADYYYMLEVSASADRTREFITSDHAWARVSGRSEGLSSKEYLHYFREMEEYAEEELDERLSFHTTGRMKVFASTVTVLAQSLLSSLGWTFGLIAILLMIHFRSVKVGLISLLPNVVPVLVPLGLMGIFGIRLTAATVMVSCLAVGLAVDNAIHFLARYRREFAGGKTVDEALEVAVRETGRAILIVSLVIAGGFLVFLFSDFRPNRYFGFLLAVAMTTAPIVDILLLPILIRHLKVR
ncbi:MAG: MMPL family transporter [Verrucomicrobiota bacterium]